MKLIYCPLCGDIRKLNKQWRLCCECGESWGRYDKDGLHAIIGGQAIPLGIDNHSFHRALEQRPEAGLGSTFTAFVIPDRCEHIRTEQGE